MIMKLRTLHAFFALLLCICMMASLLPAGAEEVEVPATSFEDHGLEINMEVGKSYPYRTCTQEDMSMKTKGKAKVTKYEITDSLKGYETPEGYEWRSATFTLSFNGTNATSYGVLVNLLDNNYYNIEQWNDTRTDETYGKNADTTTHTVTWEGKDYDECMLVISWKGTSPWSEWVDEKGTFTVKVSFRVPVGFDGAVMALVDASIPTYRGNLVRPIYEVANADSLFFRFA